MDWNVILVEAKKLQQRVNEMVDSVETSAMHQQRNDDSDQEVYSMGIIQEIAREARHLEDSLGLNMPMEDI